MQIEFLLYCFIGIYIPFQFLLYLLIFGFFPAYYFTGKIKLSNYDLLILLFLFYFIIVVPITTKFNAFFIFKGFKDWFPPTIIYFYMRFYFTSRAKIKNFLKLVIYSGVISTVYLIFEIVSKWFDIYRNYWILVQDYILKFHPYLQGSGLSFIDNIDNFSYAPGTILIRPAGIPFNNQFQGFLLLSSLIITIVGRDYILKKRKNVNPISIFLLIGIVLSTSGTHIILSLFLFLSIIIIKQFKNIYGLRNSIYKISIIVFLMMIILLTFGSSQIRDYLISMALHFYGPGGGDYASGGVVIGAISELMFNKIPLLLKTDFLGSLLGFGIDAEPIGGEAHFMGSQIARWGILGFLCYWIIIIRASLFCIFSVKFDQSIVDMEINRILLMGFLLAITFIPTLVHYNPLNLCNIFVVGFIIYAGYIAHRRSQLIRLKNSALVL